MGQRKFARILVNGFQVDGLERLVVIQVLYVVEVFSMSKISLCLSLVTLHLD